MIYLLESDPLPPGLERGHPRPGGYHGLTGNGYYQQPPPSFDWCASCGGTGWRAATRGFCPCPRCRWEADKP